MKIYQRRVGVFLTVIILMMMRGSVNADVVKAFKDGREQTEMFYKEVTALEAKKVIKENSDIFILDVRSPEEYEAGHIEGAVNVEFDTIDENISSLMKYKNKPILIYCKVGKRSRIAVKNLQERGFKKIYHMVDGISKWEYELEK